MIICNYDLLTDDRDDECIITRMLLDICDHIEINEIEIVNTPGKYHLIVFELYNIHAQQNLFYIEIEIVCAYNTVLTCADHTF